MVKAYSGIASLLGSRIEVGAYPPGSRLPSQRELAEEFQVSRPTVREALTALEMRGLVETHVGAGSFVRYGDLSTAQCVPRWPVDASPIELIGARLLIEPQVARTAAKLWTRDSLATMARPMQELERLAASPEGTMYDSELDRRFHSAVTSAVGNSVLGQLMAPLWDFMAQALWQVFSGVSWSGEDTIREAADHRAIFEAIRSRDCDSAAFYMEAHLRHVYDLLLRMSDGAGSSASSEVS